MGTSLNCRIWSEDNPQVIIIAQAKVSVWCALCAEGMIGPYLFKNDEGQILQSMEL